MLIALGSYKINFKLRSKDTKRSSNIFWQLSDFRRVFIVALQMLCCWPRIGSSFYPMVILPYQKVCI